ncbi:efflux RND transporter periplasmic adaptor subunit [Cystobacter ferrugineus]|uniref:efflux RND transporter periplasmic adaptor subunit n=1 Tax=Cystobacter ferrugineus TaxID=83449 RepID=UPI000AB25E5C|nr:efflux RND transporter periplasmic adaptor subunit [Cystobacter ferrugineus]
MSGLGLLLLVLVGGVAALRGRTARQTQGTPPSLGGRTEHAPQSPSGDKGWLGVVISEESVDLATRNEGIVESVRVQVGDRVKRGEVVATLEDRAAQQELAVAEAELQSSRAELQVAALTLEEAQERLKRRQAPGQLRTGAISEEELSAASYQERLAVAKQEIARALVLEHQARVARLRQRLAETSIRAPFDGVVASRFVAPGALLQPGQPLLHLMRGGVVQVRFAIPAAQVRQVAVGQRLVLSAVEQGWVFKGRVTQVAPEVDVAPLMVFAIAEVEVPAKDTVPAGTVMRVRVDFEQAHADIVSPERNGSNSP